MEKVIERQIHLDAFFLNSHIVFHNMYLHGDFVDTLLKCMNFEILCIQVKCLLILVFMVFLIILECVYNIIAAGSLYYCSFEISLEIV